MTHGTLLRRALELNGVAVGAERPIRGRHCVSALQGEDQMFRPRALPAGGQVALRAVVRGHRVRWIERFAVLTVAVDADPGRVGEQVVLVAIAAGRAIGWGNGVGAGEREERVVLEARRRPWIGDRVAVFAAGGDDPMAIDLEIGEILVVSMAVDALRGLHVDDALGVARAAGLVVASDEGELIVHRDLGRLPIVGRVALLAIGVVWWAVVYGSVIERRLLVDPVMTDRTLPRGALELVVGVTVGALGPVGRRVGPLEREKLVMVVKGGRAPDRGGVADRALIGAPELVVISLRVGPVRGVAIDTAVGLGVIAIGGVAGAARSGGVGPVQEKVVVVIRKLSRIPFGHGVALFTGQTEADRGVVEGGPPKVLEVAVHAVFVPLMDIDRRRVRCIFGASDQNPANRK